jgi:hypothetical protein
MFMLQIASFFLVGLGFEFRTLGLLGSRLLYHLGHSISLQTAFGTRNEELHEHFSHVGML